MLRRLAPLALLIVAAASAALPAAAKDVGAAGVCVYVGDVDSLRETEVTTNGRCGPSWASVRVEDGGVTACLGEEDEGCVRVTILAEEELSDRIGDLDLPLLP